MVSSHLGKVQFSKLFSSASIGGLTLKNRIIMSPMETAFTDEGGYFSRRDIDYYVERAKGGVGMIITQGVFVENEVEPFENIPAPFLENQKQVFRANDLVEAVHDAGAKIAVQLVVGAGRNAESLYPGKEPVSSSENAMFMFPDKMCHALTSQEIASLVRSMGHAAARAAAAGFDMIEIHGHTGYLMDQFMCSLWNKRSDEYGGSLENRMRFPLEIIAAVKESVGPNFPIGFRMSGEHKIPGGREIQETVEIARMLEKAGVAAIHIDGGCYEAIPWIFPPAYFKPGNMLEDAARVREAVSIPVFGVGSISNPAFAEEALSEGKADFLVIGRQLLADPEWVNKVARGDLADIRPCMRCNEGCIGRYLSGKPISCSVNPRVGNESRYQIKPAAESRNVAVIGGGPAGMEAARVAALRGHSVTLWEQEDQLGGQIRAAGMADFKQDIARLNKYLEHTMSSSGVKVVLGTKADADVLASSGSDVAIFATGAKPFMPAIPGIERDNVTAAYAVDMGLTTTGASVVVIGGGLVGCETALSLAREGKTVTIVEMRPALAADLNMVSRVLLLQQIEAAGIHSELNCAVQEILDSGIRVKGADGNEWNISAETVVMAVGSKSTGLPVQEMSSAFGDFMQIGDCVRPRKIGEAIREGFLAGMAV